MRYILLTCLTLSLFSCGTPPVSESIVGNWTYDHVDFKATANNPNISDYDREDLAETAMKIKSMNLEFFKDKTYDMKLNMESSDYDEHGSYAIEGDGKYISATKKSKYSDDVTERWEIVRLTEDSLTIISAKGAYVVYAKAQ
jgi:hypothetical protein